MRRLRIMHRGIGVAAAAVAAAFAVAGCGGGSSGSGHHGANGRRGPLQRATPSTGFSATPATTPQEFAARFSALTGAHMAVDPAGATGQRILPTVLPDRSARLGGYALTWSDTDQHRRDLLGNSVPDAHGLYWTQPASTAVVSVGKPFGPRLVLSEPQEPPVPDARWDRVARAALAAYTGDWGALPVAEQPCPFVGLTPLSGPTGACAVQGIPVTFVNSATTLDTPVLQARVQGMTTASTLSGGGVTEHADGRFVVVAYVVRNTGQVPLTSLAPELHLGGQTFQEDGTAQPLEPASTQLPLAPGEAIATRAVFDVPSSLIPQAEAQDGALVFPAGSDISGAPSEEIAQGWIRLTGAPDDLPPVPTTPSPSIPSPFGPPPKGAPRPQGPPATPFVRGHGKTIGEMVRLNYTIDTFQQLPPGFQLGGIPVGSHAGACTVPAPTDADRSQLFRQAERQTPGRVQPLQDDDILLADCGNQGYWAMVTWIVTPHGSRRPNTYVDEERFDGHGRWTGTATGVQPGCRMPLDAAAAWQIDVSPCGNSKRGGGVPKPGSVKPRPPAKPRPPRPQRPRPQGPQPLPAPGSPQKPPPGVDPLNPQTMLA